MPNRSVAQTFIRGLDVLLRLNAKNGSTASQIAVMTGIHDVIVRRLLNSLARQGFVTRSERTGQYWLAHPILGLSSGYREDRWITEVAKPAMNRLGRQVVWPVSLVAPSGTNITVRTNTDEFSPLTIKKSPIGHSYPLIGTASGGIYLAFCDERERENLIALLWATERKDIKSRYHTLDGFVRYIAGVRKQGYCCSDAPDRLTTISVPIIRDGRAIAALSLRYFTTAMSHREGVRRYSEPLSSCAKDIEKRLTKFE